MNALPTGQDCTFSPKIGKQSDTACTLHVHSVASPGRDHVSVLHIKKSPCLAPYASRSRGISGWDSRASFMLGLPAPYVHGIIVLRFALSWA